jgi:hypothetical protein
MFINHPILVVVVALTAGCAAYRNNGEAASLGTAMREDASRQDGLCAVDLPATRVDVDDHAEGVEIVFTSADSGEVGELRKRAARIAEGDRYRPGWSAAPAEPIAVTTHVSDIADGVKIVLVPEHAKDVDALEELIEDDLDALTDGRCTSPVGD